MSDLKLKSVKDTGVIRRPLKGRLISSFIRTTITRAYRRDTRRDTKNDIWRWNAQNDIHYRCVNTDLVAHYKDNDVKLG